MTEYRAEIQVKADFSLLKLSVTLRYITSARWWEFGQVSMEDLKLSLTTVCTLRTGYDKASGIMPLIIPSATARTLVTSAKGAYPGKVRRFSLP